MNYLRMELKVCEGCGALWLRAGIEAGVYCRTCARKLAEFPPAKGRRQARMTMVKRMSRLGVVQGGAR